MAAHCTKGECYELAAYCLVIPAQVCAFVRVRTLRALPSVVLMRPVRDLPRVGVELRFGLCPRRA